jgi:hypothetical protein
MCDEFATHGKVVQGTARVEEHKDTAAPQLKASCSMPVGDDDCRYLGEVKIRPKGRERREGQAEIESPLDLCCRSRARSPGRTAKTSRRRNGTAAPTPLGGLP